MVDYQIRVGQPSKWKEFAARNHEFLLEVEPLAALARAVFDRDIEGGPLERAIYTTGRLTVDDFWAVFILATNGYGFSARGLLRSMFERVVVGKYLVGHPDQVDRFLDYYHIVKWKQANAVTRTLGPIISDETLEKLKAERDAVVGQFKTRDCEKCGAKGPIISWADADMVSMAEQVGLAQLLFQCYYEPNEQVHHSVHALMNYMEQDATGEIINVASKPDVIDDAARSAHQLLIIELAEQCNFFHYTDLEADWEARKHAFLHIWHRDTIVDEIKDLAAKVP
jgi:hypothetical protein